MTTTKRRLLNSIGAATIALLCSAAQARASAIQLHDPSELSGGAVVTFPETLPNPFSFDLQIGTISLTFTTPGVFNTLPSDGFATDFPADAFLLADVQPGGFSITFLPGIHEFGFFAQGLIAEQTEQFTFNVFNAASLLNPAPFMTRADDNAGVGVALFIGARATNGDFITKLIISNTGPPDESLDPSFVIGPITIGEAAAADPVPEPGTLVLLGSGLLHGARRLRRRAV